MNFSFISIALAALALTAGQAAAATPTGTLSVSVSGVPAKPKKAKRAITVRAIDVRSGALVQSSESKRASVALKLAPGAYVVAVRSIDFPGKTVEAASGIAVVKSGKKTKQKLRAKPLKKSKPAKKASVSRKHKLSEYFAPASETAGMIVAGVDPGLRAYGFAQYPDGLPIDSIVTVPMSAGCPTDKPKFRLVEIARRAELMQEIDLGDSPLFDQSKKVKRGHWWKERQLVKGEGNVVNGRFTVNLTFVDIATGAVLHSASAEGAEADFIDVIDAAANELMGKICGSKVDVTFTGSGTFTLDEGAGGDTSEDHVRASFNWSIEYKNVSLDPADGTMNFATSNQIQGTWQTDGRFGAAGPGSYHCSAPIIGYNGEFAVTTLARFGGNARLTVNPYFHAQGDHNAISCSGLSSPPFASFATWGHHAANQAVVDFPVADVSAGPLSFDVAPTAKLAADCSDVIGSHYDPCTQSSTWSGKVTVTRANQ